MGLQLDANTLEILGNAPLAGVMVGSNRSTPFLEGVARRASLVWFEAAVKEKDLPLVSEILENNPLKRLHLHPKCDDITPLARGLRSSTLQEVVLHPSEHLDITPALGKSLQKLGVLHVDGNLHFTQISHLGRALGPRTKEVIIEGSFWSQSKEDASLFTDGMEKTTQLERLVLDELYGRSPQPDWVHIGKCLPAHTHLTRSWRAEPLTQLLEGAAQNPILRTLHLPECPSEEAIVHLITILEANTLHTLSIGAMPTTKEADLVCALVACSSLRLVQSRIEGLAEAMAPKRPDVAVQ